MIIPNNKELNKIKDLNYKIEKFENRLNIVKQILNENEDFFNADTFEHYSNKNKGLNIFSMLEGYATYLLSAEEEKYINSKNKVEYRFYKNEREFKRKVNKELKYNGLNGGLDGTQIDEDKAINFLITTYNQNWFTKKAFEINKNDLKGNTELSKILVEYKTFIDEITRQINNPRYGERKRFILTRIKGSLTIDMVDIKKCYNRVVEFNNCLKPTNTNLVTDLNWSNVSQIKALLQTNADNGEIGIDTDLYHLLIDLDILLKEMNSTFTDKEKEIIKLMRLSYNNTEISQALKIDKSYITRLINCIILKIKDYTNFKGWW